jgi:hypothetical protein
MVWPEDSWAFSKLFGDEATRLLASILYALATVGFVAGGIGILVRQAWYRPAVIGSALFSAVIVILFWNGTMQKLNDQGLIALFINVVILVVLLGLRWSPAGF